MPPFIAHPCASPATQAQLQYGKHSMGPHVMHLCKSRVIDIRYQGPLKALRASSILPLHHRVENASRITPSVHPARAPHA